MTDEDEQFDGRIAIIGMSGRFPGAPDVQAFWENLRRGVESVQFPTDAQLLSAGESPTNLSDPTYVRAAAPLANIDAFDAGFFGMSPRDAAVFDPQHRFFLECAWEAFEHAGYVGDRVHGSVGVFASCGLSEYMFKNVLANRQIARSVGEWLIRHTGNDTNFLATRVSYELDLHGPSMNVQTACSSTLVAVHLACQSLLSGECDLALAGGAVISPTQDRGYFYKEGEILSPDGHCRAFDANAAGTVASNAAGCVLLKPLAAAVADGDHVMAVIRGSAVNNDGRAKVGYLAPSVSGQSRVITEALAVAGVDARDVSYIETHGTGTLIGDPIEIAGLTQAFRESTADTGFCAIGSLKPNIGHAGEASGIAGLIKTALALYHREIPASINFTSPNPQADLASTPFFVNARHRRWTVDDGRTRIAGITGLGAGGTNVHVVLEEAPIPGRSGPSHRAHLLTVSARSVAGVQRAAHDLAAALRSDLTLDLADVAFTRAIGRKAFPVRRAVVAADIDSAIAALDEDRTKDIVTSRPSAAPPSIVFMMPGGGAQYAGMGRELYEAEPVYREAIDDCARLLQPTLGLDLRTVLYPADGQEEGDRRLARPSVGLPALVATEYAMATLLAAWNITPAAMIGHSAGEYAVACVAGVLTLPDALAMVALRGQLFETLPEGAMLSVPLAVTAVRAMLPVGLSIAAVNGPEVCVVAGPVEAIDAFAARLAGIEIEALRVHIDVAAHSSMLEPILDEFAAFCRTVHFAVPRVPYVSNLTGTWVTDAEVTDPRYWVRHLRETVRFADGLAAILADPNRVLLELGPGRTLTGLALAGEHTPVGATATMRHPNEHASDLARLLTALGRAWCWGVDWSIDQLYSGENRRRVPLPTYPWDRQRYWIDADRDAPQPALVDAPLTKRADIADWFSVPAWKRAIPPHVGVPEAATWLLVHDGHRISTRLRAALSQRPGTLITVRLGDAFESESENDYVVNAARIGDWQNLVQALKHGPGMPDRIVHMTAVGERRARRHRDRLSRLTAVLERDQAGLLFLAQTLSAESHPTHLSVVTQGVHAIGAEPRYPERALLHGTCRVIPRELGHVSALAIDIDVPEPRSGAEQRLIDSLLAELSADPVDDVVALRSGARWIRSWDPVRLPTPTTSPWLPGGVYLITGGMGGIGLAVAEHIASTTPGVTVALVGRSAVPPRSQWPALIADPNTDPAVRDRLAALARIAATARHLVVYIADVTDLAAMTDVVKELRGLGHVDGVIHAAGIIRDALIALRTPTVLSPVVDVKARGVVVLDTLFEKDPPELMVLCSSVSSVIGLPGQAEYTAANAFLDAFAADVNRRGRTRAVAVGWNAWREVGMAVAAARALGEREQGTTSPTRAGAVVLRPGHDDQEAADSRIYSTALSRERTWYLSEHVIRDGDALIPGTGHLEIIRSTVEADGRGASSEAAVVELRDVFFLSAFTVAPDEGRQLHLRLVRADGSVTVFSDSEAAPHVTATARLVDPGPAPVHDLAAIRARCQVRVVELDGHAEQHFMDFGPRWASLRRIEFGRGEALVTTEIPAPYRHEPAALWLHPAVMDVATGSAQELIPGFVPAEWFFVPFSYGRVLARGPIPNTARSHVVLRPTSSADLAVFDVSICADDGREVIAVEGFTMRRVSEATTIGLRRPTAAHATTGNPIDAALRVAMLPAEGVEALDRIVAMDTGPHVLASTVDVTSWISAVDAEASELDPLGSARTIDGPPQFARPDISVTFEAPRTPIERDLSLMWQELLGVERVGRDDDFFELGGQSLVAVRLFTRIRKRYSVDLPLALLFEAPTIAECAVVLARVTGLVDEPADAEAEPVSTSTTNDTAVTTAPTFRSIVTIQRGGDRRPYFCVHGAGGNVLNFRDMSMAMGRNQPFFGLQSRGVDGVTRPAETIEEMAAEYLAEVRRVQPHGPYLFGGYSGGGLVAYEMAQQVTAVGEQVDRVILLDTIPVTTDQIAITLSMRLRRLRETPGEYLRDVLERKVGPRSIQRDERRLDEYLTSGGTVPRDLRELHVERAFGHAVRRYELRPWEGRVVLLRADEHHFIFDALGESYGWDAVVTGALEVIRVPGNHDTLLLEPNATTLARVLRQVLDADVPSRIIPA